MSSLVRKMIQGAPRGRAVASGTYEEAVKALNTLQSNKAYIDSFDNAAQNQKYISAVKLEDTKKYLIRSGISMEQLRGLSVIHVAGTKGKGSTCAFTEAILRAHGYRTGFFSSPHLISVCERFRINGSAISSTEFSRHFWPVYDLLYEKRDNEQDMPLYFKFLTVLSFHIFLKAKVDVAIMEVGLGGEYDCTNIVNNTVCTGITSLGLDHTNILGDTLESIAYQKSGIFKPGAPAFTVTQPSSAMPVLKERALEKKCTLNCVPSLNSYSWTRSLPTLGILSSVQSENASLAIQLAATWIKATRHRSRAVVGTPANDDGNANDGKISGSRSSSSSSKNNNNNNNNNNHEGYADAEDAGGTSADFFSLEKAAAALESCRWPGRTQVLLGRTMDFYIDGAHTVESMECCASWYKDIVANTREDVGRYLIFNTKVGHDSRKLLAPLKEFGFKKVFFVPNFAGPMSNSDQNNVKSPVASQLEKCREHAEIWGDNSVLANSVYEALGLIREESGGVETAKPQVLVTGSLHLVGALLLIVDPELKMSTTF